MHTTPVAALDLSIFVAFLLLSLVIGLKFGRQVRNIREFALGGKRFSTATLTATIIATWISGGYMFYYVENIYTKGLYFIVAAAAGGVSLLFTALLGRRMGPFLNNVSIAEAMGELYGAQVQRVTALSGVLREIGKLAIQFKVIAKVLSLLLGLEDLWVTVAVSGIVIAYASFGGVRAVTVTDVMQLIMFSLLMPRLSWIIWYHIGDPAQVFSTLATNPHWSWSRVLSWSPDSAAMLTLMFYFAMPSFSASTFQRIAMAKDVQQVQRAFIYAAGVDFLVVIVTGWVALLLLADQPNLAAEEVVPYLVNAYAHPGLKGFFAVGVMAMAMSTADSKLNAASVMLANDIAIPYKVSYSNPLHTVRLASLLIGTAALSLAFYIQDLLALLLTAASLSAPLIDVPLLLAIFGFRTGTRSVLLGMASGGIVTLWWLTYYSSNALLPGMGANLLGLLIGHYVLGLRKRATISPIVVDQATDVVASPPNSLQ